MHISAACCISCGSSEQGLHAHSPTLVRIAGYTQAVTNHMLELLTEWIDGALTHGHGRWVYALLTTVEKVPHADTIACLRALMRKCLAIQRACIDRDDDELAAASIIITLRGRYFGQGDLLRRK